MYWYAEYVMDLRIQNRQMAYRDPKGAAGASDGPTDSAPSKSKKGKKSKKDKQAKAKLRTSPLPTAEYTMVCRTARTKMPFVHLFPFVFSSPSFTQCLHSLLPILSWKPGCGWRALPIKAS